MKTRNVTLAALAVLSMVVTGCTKTTSTATSTGTSTSAASTSTEKVKTSITVCLASEPDHVDPALNSSVDGASLDVHLFGGLYRYVDSGMAMVWLRLNRILPLPLRPRLPMPTAPSSTPLP
jgi:oligopeptide transport system substrate-binding protein